VGHTCCRCTGPELQQLGPAPARIRLSTNPRVCLCNFGCRGTLFPIHYKNKGLELTITVGNTTVFEGFRLLTEQCGADSAAKGWHEDRPEGGIALANWQGNRLMLMVSELVEAHDELRNGHAAGETYYPTATGADLLHSDGPFKPEGVPSELADTVIRIFDFCYTEKIDLGAIIEEKLAYNRTRERMHGGKKF